MKKLIILLIPIFMCFNLSAQKKVFGKNNSKKTYSSEDADIVFTESTIKIPTSKTQELAPLLAALIPSAVDLGFKIAGNALEKKIKKFSGEYSIQKSYLRAGGQFIPNIKFYRNVTINGQEQPALEIVIEAHAVNVNNDNILGFVYSVKSINLVYSKAISKGGSMDYTIEIKPTFIVGGEKKAQELSPITVSSVFFENKTFPDALKHRTDIIPLPKNAFLSEVALKIVETNPSKIKTEKILESVTAYKDDAKTIINNFLPEKKDEVNEEEGDGEDANEEDSNKDNEKENGKN